MTLYLLVYASQMRRYIYADVDIFELILYN